MFDINTKNDSTPEFSIYKLRSPYTKGVAYYVEFDGVPLDPEPAFASVEAAHTAVKAYCRDRTVKAAGVTEVFGRNRQYITTPRYGFKTWKEPTI